MQDPRPTRTGMPSFHRHRAFYDHPPEMSESPAHSTLPFPRSPFDMPVHPIPSHNHLSPSQTTQANSESTPRCKPLAFGIRSRFILPLTFLRYRPAIRDLHTQTTKAHAQAALPLSMPSQTLSISFNFLDLPVPHASFLHRHLVIRRHLPSLLPTQPLLPTQSRTQATLCVIYVLHLSFLHHQYAIHDLDHPPATPTTPTQNHAQIQAQALLFAAIDIRDWQLTSGLCWMNATLSPVICTTQGHAQASPPLATKHFATSATDSRMTHTQIPFDFRPAWPITPNRDMSRCDHFSYYKGQSSHVHFVIPSYHHQHANSHASPTANSILLCNQLRFTPIQANGREDNIKLIPGSKSTLKAAVGMGFGAIHERYRSLPTSTRSLCLSSFTSRVELALAMDDVVIVLNPANGFAGLATPFDDVSSSTQPCNIHPRLSAKSLTIFDTNCSLIMVKNNKGGRRGWPTVEQDAWLRRYEPLYRASQERGKEGLEGFWSPSFEDWFGRWAEKGANAAELAANIRKKKLRIKQWYNNHCRNNGTSNRRTGKGRFKVLDLDPKKPRKLQPFQAYSRLYYNTKPHIKATIAEEWSAHLVLHPEEAGRAGPRLPFRNKVLRDLLAKETQEVKDEVERRRNDGSLDNVTDPADEDEMALDPPAREVDVDPEEAKRRAKAEALQASQDLVVTAIQRMLDQLEAQAGLICTVLLGGPEPKRGGKLMVLSLHSGRNQLGHDFREIDPGHWAEYIETPFQAHLRKVFPRHVREERALPSTISTQPDGSADGDKSSNRSKGKGKAEEDAALVAKKRAHNEMLLAELTSARKTRTSASTPSASKGTDVNNGTGEPSAASSQDPAGSSARTSSATTDNDPAGSSAQTSVAATANDSDDDDGSDVETDKESDNGQDTESDTDASDEESDDGSDTESQSGSKSTGASDKDKSHGSDTGDKQTGASDKDSAEWPTWLGDAVEYFKSISSSPKWAELVDKWVAFEAHLSFPTAGARLSCTDRPDAVTSWLRAGRRINSPPTISQLKTYTAAWWAWWKSLQPDWRQATSGGGTYQASVPDEKWVRTHVGGTNGMFVVVLTLAWWIGKLNGKADNKDLAKAIDDVKWVLSEMTFVKPVGGTDASGGGAKAAKRPVDDDGGPAPKKKRRKTRA